MAKVHRVCGPAKTLGIFVVMPDGGRKVRGLLAQPSSGGLPDVVLGKPECQPGDRDGQCVGFGIPNPIMWRVHAKRIGLWVHGKRSHGLEQVRVIGETLAVDLRFGRKKQRVFAVAANPHLEFE